MLSVAGLGVFATLVLPAALGGGGGTTIASAPTLPLGLRVGHAYKLAGCSGYGEIWRISLARGDHLRLDYGSKNGQPVQVLVLAPSVTDETADLGVLAEAWTSYRDDLVFDATKAGRYSIVLRTFYACETSLWYVVTAHVTHAAK